jgi:L-amino acid N-acyltransferase YncA
MRLFGLDCFCAASATGADQVRQAPALADPDPSTQIRPALASDADAIARIYEHYVLNTTISFEEQPVAPAQMWERIREVMSNALPWLVAERNRQIVGYAFAVKWKARAAYRHSVEISVYVDPKLTGAGIGTQLYRALLAMLRERSIHTVIGGIALPNEASIALHERMGFSKVAHFSEVGYKFGQWIDVGYWQKSL